MRHGAWPNHGAGSGYGGHGAARCCCSSAGGRGRRSGNTPATSREDQAAQAPGPRTDPDSAPPRCDAARDADRDTLRNGARPGPDSRAQCVTLPLHNVRMRHSRERGPHPDSSSSSYWPGMARPRLGISSGPGSHPAPGHRTGARRPARAHRRRGTCRRSRGPAAVAAARSRSTGCPAC